MPRVADQDQKLGENHRWDFPSGPQVGTDLTDPSDLELTKL